MRRRAYWKAIIGGLIILTFTVGGAYNLLHSADSMMGNIGAGISYVLWIALGVFLIMSFLKDKAEEDAGRVYVAPEPNSPDDIELLARKRNRIFGYVIFFGVVGSINYWLFNNYTAGWDSKNIAVIFDLLAQIPIIYFLIQLLWKKKNTLNALLWTLLVYGFGSIVINIWRANWSGAVSDLLVAGYFLYAIKAPVSRKNHRIAHFITLPLVFILVMTAAGFENARFDALWKDEVKGEQEFANITTDLSYAFSSVFKDQYEIDQVNIAQAQEEVRLRREQGRAVVDMIKNIRAEYLKLLNDPAGERTIKRIDKLLVLFGVHDKELDKMEEFLNYIATLNPSNITAKQKLEIDNFRRGIDQSEKDIRAAGFDLNQ